ncbi:aspartate aminotransferase family protein [Lentzea tibetensis]|uniref:Aspartate aminotransferase family protein n=1 Tax=Lentzea tibetensis TaxID=2591470 RepID=A0A563ETA3_9PSEU|nr:aminotransferase class V-fold PLP-dependent enzyme [Lentzea tibetensis]TWP50883.1 aspartate aminotransferase family protein [Lentzea tibetensis]
MDLQFWIEKALVNHEKWTAEFGTFTPHSSVRVDDTAFGDALEQLQERLRDNYPFFHPRYAGQMLKPPHPAAVVGYLSAMLINPNNHALDGGPATAQMEREVVAQLATMFGYGEEHLGHLTSSGTIANLEALFVARELHPGKGVAFSAEAHYTHSRMCGVLGMRGHKVPVDGRGRMDLDALEALLRTGEIGTVVLTPGTTALGAVEPVHEALALRERYGVRIHVDGAYGGFFTLLAGTELAPEPWRAIAQCDSIVVDPHKHGLQPYGCGAVLFRDPSVGRYYLHDSPYTYFTSDELHLGEISLECSRAGAAAAGLWLTFQLLPPTREGLGEVLAAGRRAAVRWADMISASDELVLYQEPELDIVTYFPRTSPLALSAIDEASNRVMHDGMNAAADPVFLSVARASSEAFAQRHPQVDRDADGARVLRSVLMKPESEDHLDTLHARVLSLL